MSEMRERAKAEAIDPGEMKRRIQWVKEKALGDVQSIKEQYRAKGTTTEGNDKANGKERAED